MAHSRDEQILTEVDDCRLVKVFSKRFMHISEVENANLGPATTCDESCVNGTSYLVCIQTKKLLSADADYFIIRSGIDSHRRTS